MTRQSWFRSSFTRELRPLRHLENRIVFCNDCLANRTLWVSASGTLDCSLCGSQNWMHLSVPIANRSRLGKSGSRVETVARDSKASSALDVRATSVPRPTHPDRELVKNGLRLITLGETNAAASHFVWWLGSCGRAVVQSIHEMSGQLGTPLHDTLLRIQRVFRHRFCCIRDWLSPAKQT